MKYSQGEQDTIIANVFKKIGTTNKFCVEFGFNSDTLTSGSGANSARLVLEEGWTGLFFDGSHFNRSIGLHKVLLTPENICSVFQSHQVPREFDYLSIDVDSIDLWLFKSILTGNYRPRVISVEYNSNYGLDECVTARPGTNWNGDSCYGASLSALYYCGAEFGYNLVAVEPLLDAFFVRGDLSVCTPLTQFEQYTNLPAHPPATLERQKVMMEYLH